MDKLNTTMESLYKGMENFVSTKTVVGEPVTIGDTIILPLADVAFGVAAGASVENNKNNGAGGLGGKITPSAVLIINGSTTRLVSVKNQDAITKVLDMVPDLLDRFTPAKKEADKEVSLDEDEI